MERSARSPGKLILGGEHAVVQGGPALAMAVNLEARVRMRPLGEPRLRITLPERTPVDFPLPELPQQLTGFQRRHRQYLSEGGDFKNLQPEPETLLALCAAMLDPRDGAELVFESDLPPGSGLGSSAAFILALLKALRPELPAPELRSLAVRGEHFQHGRSSGLDVEVSLRGGLLCFREGRAEPLPLSRPLPPFTVYHSGRPQSSTGECVQQSGKVFAAHPDLKDAFAETTGRMSTALREGNEKQWRGAVRDNHRLLCRLGVVPASVEKHISELEESGGAAKVCGAGSVRGNAAGMVLVCGPGPHPVPSGWRRLSLQLSTEGTRLIP